MQTIAIVRPPAASFIRALSNHPERNSIDFPQALEQHGAYTQALKQRGLQVITLDPQEAYPDSVFVEDTAIILEDGALICSMKAETRRGETQTVRTAIEPYRPVEFFPASCTIDGGDVLDTGDTLYVGLSGRTDRKAVEFLATKTQKKVVAVPVLSGLHLKSSVSYLGGNLLVIYPPAVDASCFKQHEWIEVEEQEVYAANCLAIGKTVLMAERYPLLSEQIEAKGFNVVTLPMSEFEKADGGVTCLSLIISPGT